MSLRSRMRALVKHAEALREEEQAARSTAWLETLSVPQLRALRDLYRARAAETGDPEARLTPDEMAEALGMTVEQLAAAWERADQAWLAKHKGPLV